MVMALSSEPEAMTTAPIRPSTISEKYFGRAELEGHLGQRRGEGGDHQRAHAAGEERAHARRGQRRPGPALARHLVAVDHRGPPRSDSPGRFTKMAVVEPPYSAP